MHTHYIFNYRLPMGLPIYSIYTMHHDNLAIVHWDLLPSPAAVVLSHDDLFQQHDVEQSCGTV